MTKMLFSLWFVLAAPVMAAAGPGRVATCFVAADEIAIELLTATGQIGRLAAVSTLAEDPKYSFAAPIPASIKRRCGAELESLLAAHPDLVILASFNRPELIDRLRDAKVPAHVLKSFNSFADIAANITTIGGLLGTQAEAAKLASAVLSFAPKTTNTKGPTVLGLSSDGVVAAGDTLFNDVIRAAGGVNLAEMQGLKGWPRLSAEALAKLDPDWLVAAGDPQDPKAMGQALAQARGASGYAAMRAVKLQRIILMPEREIGAASHHILKAVQRLAAALKGPA